MRTRPTVACCTTLALLLGACTSTNRVRRDIRAEWLETERGSVPLQVLPSHHIYASGEVNGHKTSMLIDTGAGLSVLNENFARRIGVRSAGKTNVKGVGGIARAGIVGGITISLGGLELHGIVALIIDLSEIEARLGHAIPVIVGRGLFDNAIVEIDYPRQRMVCHQPKEFHYDGPGETIELRRVSSGLRAAHCRVEGLPPAWFQIDTGSGSTVDVFEFYTKKHKLLENRSPTSMRLDGGVGGFNVEPIATLRTFRFAGHELREVPVSFPHPTTGSFATKQFAGNIGGAILSRFRIFLDFGGNRMYVEPGPGVDRPFERCRVGLSTRTKDGRVEVVFVSPGSPAEKAGIRKGMVLAQVGRSRTTHPRRLRARLRRASRRAAGRSIELHDGDGRVYRVELADYY